MFSDVPPIHQAIHEMILRPPYKEWNPDRIVILLPDKKDIHCKCAIQYKYKLCDGIEIQGPLLVEFPNGENQNCVSDFGVTEILRNCIGDGSENSEHIYMPREGTGRFKIFRVG
jgi:hypothetical protein